MLLAINTASSKTAIALIEDKKIIAEKSWHSQNDEAEKLMPAIDHLISESGKKYENISQVLAIKGPGSFTGLRVGITVANTIAHLNNCELFAIDSFEYQITFLPPDSSLVSNTALLLYAGAAGVYFSLPSDKPNYATKAQNIPLIELPAYLKKNNIKKVFGDVTPEQKETLKNVEFLENKNTFAEMILKIDLSQLKSQKIIDPVYLKNPGITQIKK